MTSELLPFKYFVQNIRASALYAYFGVEAQFAPECALDGPAFGEPMCQGAVAVQRLGTLVSKPSDQKTVWACPRPKASNSVMHRQPNMFLKRFIYYGGLGSCRFSHSASIRRVR